jgi:hypothetical protein
MPSLRENRILPYVGRRLFSPPYMPRLLIVLPLLFIAAFVLLTLVGQPPEYWLDYDRASHQYSWLQKLLAIHPLVFAGIACVYAGLIALLLDGLSRLLAVPLWMIACFLHLRWMVTLYTGLGRIFGSTCSTTPFYTAGWVIAIVSVGLMGFWGARTLLSTKGGFSRPWLVSQVVVVTVVLLVLPGLGMVRTITTPVAAWRQIETESRPSPRMESPIAYDIDRQRAVLFGGLTGWSEGLWVFADDTWEWDGENWMQCFPDIHPSGRGSHAMAYDEKRGVVVLFGGVDAHGYLNDTWEWDGRQWQQRHPSNRPPAREDHRMIYNPQSGKIVLYGGYQADAVFLVDAWEWDGEQWSPIILATKSPTTSGFGVFYDQDLEGMVAIIGGDESGTWIWQADSWGKLQLETEPPTRGYVELVYDPLEQHAVVFGGSGPDGTLLDSTWVFEGLRWQKIDAVLRPSARWAYSAFYDGSRGRVIIFGGYAQDYMNDMWELVLPTSD